MNNFIIVIVVLLVATAAAGGAFYVSYYKPLLDEADDIKAEIRRFEQQKAQLATIDQELEEFRKEIGRLTEQKDQLQMEANQLETVVPRVLESTEIVANKFDVRFQDIRISPLVRAEDWSELPVELTILGTFQNIGQFLKVMEERRIVNLAAGSMNVSVSAEVDRATQSPMLSVTLSAKVYILGRGI